VTPFTRGGACTATLKLQVAVRWSESDATHDTGVEPTGKLAPLEGAQTTDTGGAPPATVAGA
jgi:hypothetical protein